MEEKTAQKENLTTQPANNPVILTPPENEVKNVEPDKSFMHNKTLMLIGVLALITVILLGLALYVGLPSKPGGQKQVAVIKTTLSALTPVATSANVYTSNITLTTERGKTTAVEIELSYDPKVLSNVDIKPGPFFSNPTILSKKIDAVNGKVSYILGIGLGQYPVDGNGTIAILSFTPLLKSGIATLVLLPKSEVTVAGTRPSILTNVKGIQFPFGSATPTK
jgi:hypothetical protein